MLRRLLAGSLRRPPLVLLTAAVCMIAGGFAAGRARLDVFPEFSSPTVTVQTEAPHLAAEDVERLVTWPLESVLQGISGRRLVRSQSIRGLSVIDVIFRDGSDLNQARRQVAERLAEVSSQLPSGTSAPRLVPATPAAGRLLSVGFTSSTLSPGELRERVQRQVQPILQAVEGVAQVGIVGGELGEFLVDIDPEHLGARHGTVDQVIAAVRHSLGWAPAGFRETPGGQRVIVRPQNRVESAEDLDKVVVFLRDGFPVLLDEVAQVREVPGPKFGDASIDGKPGVILIAHRLPEADSLAVTATLERRLHELAPTLRFQGITYHPALFRQANFIDQALANVTVSLAVGAGLVAALLFLFLWNPRTALISLVAIPSSLLGALLLLGWMGYGLDTLTLAGLAIAVGEVVDDAVIDVENIWRRLRENADRSAPRSAAAVVLEASLEVRGAVVYATFMVVLVFVPLFFLSGLQGKLFQPLALAYVLAIGFSLLVALTLTPVLALLLLPGVARARESPLKRWLERRYERLLRALAPRFPLVLTLVVLGAGAACVALARFGGEFLPTLRENHFVVHLRGLPGTSLANTMSAGNKIASKLKEHPAVRSVAVVAGRVELGEDTWDVDFAEMEVALHEVTPEERDVFEAHLRQTLAAVPGHAGIPMTFLTERIQETLAGAPAEVVVRILGDDWNALDRAAQAAANLLAEVPGAADVRVDAGVARPELVVRPRLEDLARRGLPQRTVLDAVGAASSGLEAGGIPLGRRMVPVKVSVASPYSAAPVNLGALRLDSPQGQIHLEEVADIFLTEGRDRITHEDGLRRLQATCSVRGRDLESFVRELEARLPGIVLRPGPDGSVPPVTLRVEGEHVAARRARWELLLGGAIAGCAILAVLALALRCVRSMMLMALNIPFAMMGGVAVLHAAGGILDVGAAIGFVTLFGVTVRNGLMLLAHWKQLAVENEAEPAWDRVVRGARDRLAPILMTALSTGLALLPLALGGARPGQELEGPLAQVILGGLVSSTFLNLLVLPLLYRRWVPAS